jgi:dihydrofolate reductase
MSKIVVSENITLDGAVQDPTGEEGVGGWFTEVSDTDREGFAELFSAEARDAAALLMGGRSYEWFATRWATRTGEWADRLRSLPKYVVGSALKGPDWDNATLLKADEIADLKRTVAGDIVVNGSGRLVRTLIEQGLVDEWRLLLYPVVASAGAGARLFGGEKVPLRLSGTRKVGDSLILLTYHGLNDH